MGGTAADSYCGFVDDNKVQSRAEPTQNNLTSIIAHELNGPLAVITGLTRTMRKNWDRMTPERAKDCLDALERQATVLARLTNDLLNLRQFDDGHLEIRPRKVDISMSVAEAIAATERPVRISVEQVIEDATAAYVDPARLDQILRNLLANSYRFASTKVTISIEKVAEEIVLSVSDDGPGVDPAVVPRLFEVFGRGPADDDATDRYGIGLSLVEKLTSAMGGSVWYEPAAPTGACFRVSLPAYEKVVVIPAAEERLSDLTPPA